MHQKMPVKLKNWELALLALLCFCLFMSLGVWQLNRANQKDILLKSFADRGLHAPLTVNDFKQLVDKRFYRARLHGHFDNQHSLLLDNRTFKGQVGYEIYTPFKADGLDQVILVDRGFVPLGKNRQTLPSLREVTGKVTIMGMLNVPPTYVAFGQLYDVMRWPLRIEFIQLDSLAKLLHVPLFSYVLCLSPDDPAAYAIEWQIVIMAPERHRGYAVQWFALALTLLILFVALNRRS